MECGTEEIENPKDHFQKAAVPNPVLPHSIATASLVGHIMYQKFAMGIPFNRQEKDWYRMGLVLPRANMANWTIRCSEEWLTPIYNRIHERLLNCGVLHMDETRIQCNKELLSGFHGYLTTDAYISYEKVENIKRNLCWAHVRRYFIESIPLNNKGKEIPGSKGAEGREYINLLFKLEDEMKDLTYNEKKDKRQDASRSILDAFWTWVNETAALSTTNEKLTKAHFHSFFFLQS
ncbi:MAG: transposase [Anaerocolumna sp.]